MLAERVRAVSAASRGAARRRGRFLALGRSRRQSGDEGEAAAEGEATEENCHWTGGVIGSFTLTSPRLS